MKQYFSRPHVVQILWVLGIGSFLTIIAPFGATRGMSLVWSWIYWTGFVAYGAICAQFTIPLLVKHLGHWPRPVLYLIISLVITLLVSIGIFAVSALMGQPIPLTVFPQLYGYVWVISAAITTVMVLRDGKTAANADEVPGSKFNKRIPARIAGGILYAVSAEDHYLRIRTSRGDDLILMRLGDALEELDGLDGMRTHRSWWVAREAVQQVHRDKNKILLELRDGTMAPVSRTYAPSLRQAGWF